MRTWLGRLARDNARKITGAAEAVRAAFASTLARIGQLLRQQREDRGREKIYALHALEVECIGKGKASTRFEFGVKVSLATTNRPAPGGQFVIGPRASPGNSFDGHTLAAQIARTERITGGEARTGRFTPRLRAAARRLSSSPNVVVRRFPRC